MGIEPTSEVWDELAGNGFMPPRRGSVQIDRGGSGSGVFGALRAPATIRSRGFGLTVSEQIPFTVSNIEAPRRVVMGAMGRHRDLA